MATDNSVLIAGGGGIRVLNGNGKKYNKDKKRSFISREQEY